MRLLSANGDREARRGPISVLISWSARILSIIVLVLAGAAPLHRRDRKIPQSGTMETESGNYNFNSGYDSASIVVCWELSETVALSRQR